MFKKLNRMAAGHRRPKSEDGQIIIVVAFAIVVMFGMVGLAIDVGRLYAAKAELSRAVDAAALAGVVEFPDTTTAEAKAIAYLDANEPDAAPDINADTANNALSVDATKTVNMFFVRVMGIDSATVSAHAKAGFGVAFLDAAIAIDATGSMDGSPLEDAKDAAENFKNTLLGSSPNGRTVIGVTPFRGCFRSSNPSTYAPMPSYKSYCVNQDSQVTYLSSSPSGLDDGITGITAVGGSGTNMCLGMLKGKEILDGSGNHVGEENSRRYLILLSDGDNTYNSYSYKSSSPSAPYSTCRPSLADDSDRYVDTRCRSAQTRERDIDEETWNLAQEFEGDNVEIYVVGFGVCDHDASPQYSESQCESQIGNTSSDNTADERLLKCVASSTAGTNDHYYWARNSDDLPAIFTQIAQQIAHRLIE